MRVQKEIGPEGRRGLKGKLERRTIGPKGTLERRQGKEAKNLRGLRTQRLY
jgi:hypothetical protein